MTRYVLRRLLFLLFVVVGISVLAFFVSQAIPGDAARAAAGPDASEATVQHMRERLGLDKPLIVQYGLFLQRVLQGDLGTSIRSGRPVTQELLTYYPATVELTVSSLLFSCLIGLPLGVLSALRRGQLSDQGLRVVSLFAISLPVFWLGLVYQLVFYNDLHWLPAGGQVADTLRPPARLTGFLTVDSLLLGRPDIFFSTLQHLVLPMVTLSSITVAEVSRITRASVLEVLGESYVTTARAKGLRQCVVMTRHVLKNAATPILTVVGLRFGHNLGGAVLTETIFSWPGVGRFAVVAIENKDFPVIVAFAMTIGALYSIVNLLVDLGQAWVDPRAAS